MDDIILKIPRDKISDLLLSTGVEFNKEIPNND